MSEDPSSAIWRLVAVHLLLAVAPVGMGFMTIDSYYLPLLWSLASVPLAQIMLVSIAAGMTAWHSIIGRVVTILLTGTYLAIWSSVGQDKLPQVLLKAYVQNLCTFLVLLALLTLIMAGLRNFMGTIRVADKSDPPQNEGRFHFSLWALLAVFTGASVILGLARLSHMRPSATTAGGTVIEYMLAVIVYAMNTLAMIWATLGEGQVKRRLAVVFGVAFLLGLSLAFGAGNSPEFEPWWFFASLTLIVIVPTIIVVVSLLYLRRHGYRLIPPANQSAPHSQTV